MSDAAPPPALPALGPDDVRAAIAAGLLTDAQARALAAFSAARAEPLAPPPADASADEENVRFVTSFNDVFVTIGILLLVGATGFLLAGHSALAAAGAALVLIWGLSEIFARRWRMAFPSLILTAGLVASAAATGATAAHAVGAGEPLAAIAAGLTALIIGYLHWRRFGVPISVAAAVAGAGLTALALLHAVAPRLIEDHAAPVLLGLGLAVFGLAMWWDASDRARRTRRTDVAFWLHVLAAPLIVHPLVSTAGLEIGALRPDVAAIIFALFAVLAFVALVVDRRALLVSALVYLGVSTGTLIDRFGWAIESSGPLAVGVVGAVVLVLAVGWAPLRRLALRPVPRSIRALVPEPRSAQGATP